MRLDLHIKFPLFFQVLMKLEFSQQIFDQKANIVFHQNRSCGGQIVPCGRTDMTYLIVAFRNLANASTKWQDVLGY